MIGNDVWIGYEALIMPGVKTGNGAIVSSRTVVVTDVLPYTIVAGNLTKSIKQRFAQETVAKRNEIAWWDWPIQKITEHLEKIAAGDVDALCAENHSREGEVMPGEENEA